LLIVVATGAGAASVWRAVSGGERRPEQLTLAQLVFGQEDFSGRRIRTSGVVQRFGPEDGALRLHYVIADKADHRVKLDGGDPARFVGRAVEVVGRFRMTETAGRTIDVEQIEPGGQPRGE
jgi:hypothetical protein